MGKGGDGPGDGEGKERASERVREREKGVERREQELARDEELTRAPSRAQTHHPITP